MADKDKRVKSLSEIGSKLNPKFVREHSQAAGKILNSLPLEQQLALALSRRGKDRAQLIALSQKMRALVRMLPEAELYLTLKETGEDDSLALLALASQDQLTYIFDLEFWDQDSLQPERIVRWLDLLRRASPVQLQSWLQHADEELLIGSLQKLIQIYVADPDNLGAEDWRDSDDIFTLDEQYYFKPRDNKYRQAIERTLIYLRDLDAEQFYTIMDKVRMVLSSELEDIAYRIRQGRLEDYGFYNFEDAFAIYHFLSPEKMKELEKNPEKPEPAKTIGVRYPIMLGRELPSLLKDSLSQLTDPELEDFSHQFAGLANKIMIADAMDLTELENLKLAVGKVFGYLEIGLSVWSEGRLEQAAEILRRQWLQHIFQAGFSQVLRLRFRAQKISNQDWFKNLGKPFDLFGEAEGKRIRGLIQGRPKFYSEEKTLELREFRSRNDLQAAEKSLDQAEFCEKLFFQVLSLDREKLKNLISAYPFELNFSVILATLLVSGVVRGKPEFEPIGKDELSKFIKQAMSKEAPGKIASSLNDDFLKWLASKMKDAGMEDEDRLKEFLEATIKSLELELGRMKGVKKIEPKLVSSVVMMKEKVNRK